MLGAEPGPTTVVPGTAPRISAFAKIDPEMIFETVNVVPEMVPTKTAGAADGSPGRTASRKARRAAWQFDCVGVIAFTNYCPSGLG